MFKSCCFCLFTVKQIMQVMCSGLTSTERDPLRWPSTARRYEPAWPCPFTRHSKHTDPHDYLLQSSDCQIGTRYFQLLGVLLNILVIVMYIWPCLAMSLFKNVNVRSCHCYIWRANIGVSVIRLNQEGDWVGLPELNSAATSSTSADKLEPIMRKCPLAIS